MVDIVPTIPSRDNSNSASGGCLSGTPPDLQLLSMIVPQKQEAANDREQTIHAVISFPASPFIARAQKAAGKAA